MAVSLFHVAQRKFFLKPKGY